MSSKIKVTAATEDARPALVPKLRFPAFRGVALRCVQLGDVTEEGRRRNGKKHSAASVMGVTKADGIVPMEARLIAADIERYKLVEHNWFAYNPMRLNIGSISRWKGDSEILVSPDYVVFKCITDDESGIAPSYLDQFRQTKVWEDFVTEGGDGGVRVRIYYKDIARLQLALPSLPEQERIAECLNSADELMAAQARKVDALKAHKRGLMQQLFPREGETQPCLRFPEFQNTGEWKRMTFGQAATFYNGRAYKQEELLESGKYPVLRVGNFFTSNTWYHSDLELDETKYCEYGDLLYAWSASFGPRIWRGEKSIYHYHIWKVIEQRGVDKQFLFITLDNETENMKAKTTNGLGIMHITKGAIESWESTFPTMAEQRKIAGCLTSLDNTITAEIEKLDALKTHKDGLMQQLFPSPDAIQS